MFNPGKKHWNAVKSVMRYFRGAARYEILFSYGGCNLVGFVESAYGSGLDKMMWTTGYVFTLGGSAITWKSILRPTIDLFCKTQPIGLVFTPYFPNFVFGSIRVVHGQFSLIGLILVGSYVWYCGLGYLVCPLVSYSSWPQLPSRYVCFLELFNLALGYVLH